MASHHLQQTIAHLRHLYHLCYAVNQKLVRELYIEYSLDSVGRFQISVSRIILLLITVYKSIKWFSDKSITLKHSRKRIITRLDISPHWFHALIDSISDIDSEIVYRIGIYRPIGLSVEVSNAYRWGYQINEPIYMFAQWLNLKIFCEIDLVVRNQYRITYHIS